MDDYKSMIKQGVINLVVAVYIVTFANFSIAAEVSVIDGRYKGEKYVGISGPIEKGDFEKVRRASIKAINISSSELVFHINTTGGDIEEAMKIGRFARKLLATTFVYGKVIYSPGDERIKLGEKFQQSRFSQHVLSKEVPLTDNDIVHCYSAGVLILYGGVRRYIEDNGDFRTREHKIIPVIGIHRPYFNSTYFASLSPEKADKKYKILKQKFTEYLLEMGAPQSLIYRMLKKSSKKVELIPAKEFREFLDYTVPFVDEWLNAKCDFGASPYALNEKEMDEFIAYLGLQGEALIKGLIKPGPEFEEFEPPGFNLKRIKDLLERSEKVSKHVNKILACEDFAISKFQVKWALENQAD